MSKFPKKVGPDTKVTRVDLDQEEVYFRGERLTEDRAERLADEFERRGANLIPGGKSLSGDGSHSPTVQYRVPAALRNQVEKAAEREGVTVSRLGRLALEEYLERHSG